MVQIVKQTGFGTELGQALGSGLGQGVKELVEQKLQKMKTTPGLEALGFNREQAEQLADLDPKLLQEAIRGTFKERAALGKQQKEQQKEQRKETVSEGLLEALSLPSQQGQQQFSPQEQGEERQRDIQEERVEPFVPQSPGAKGATEIENVERALAGKNIPARDKAEILENVEKRQDRFLEQQDKIDKKNEKWLDGARESNDGSVQADERLDFMEELIEGGELPGPLLTTFADLIERGIPIPFTGGARLGINLKGLLFSTQGQQFDKITKDFAKDARKFFPRVTEGQVKLFLETVPTLLQSNEGKKEIVKTLRFFNAANKLTFDTAQGLIEQNKGFQPPNLQSRVDKIVKPQKAELQKQLQQQMKEAAKFAKRQRTPPKTSLAEIAGGFQRQ